ncbi:hypothetical protein [Aurantivibrio plasticivorans]
MRRNKLKRFSVAIVLLLVSSWGWTAEPQFRGFISQSVVFSDDNPLFDDDTGVNFNLREIGLNTSWQITDRFRLAGQLMSRKAWEIDDGDPTVDFLLVDYKYLVSASAMVGVRLGRTKLPYGVYNTTRDVPHARPGIFVPQSVYFESMRNVLLATDGGHLYFNFNHALADINVDLSYGKIGLDGSSLEYLIFQRELPGDFDSLESQIFKVEFLPSGALRDMTLALSLVDASSDYDDAPNFTPAEQFAGGVALASDPTLFTSYITQMEISALLKLLSLQYSMADWIITAEYLNADIAINNAEVLHIPTVLGDSRSDSQLEGYYGQVEWLLSSQISLYGRYEELYFNDQDRDGEDYQRTVGGNPVTQYQKALSLGARWYFTPDWSVTGEFSSNRGAAFINGSEEVDYSALKKRWHAFILQMSYHF